MRPFRLHTINHRAGREPDRGPRIDTSFWLGLPRLIPLCRLLGHRPVVDGVDYGPGPGRAGGRERRARWACCDRCGIRPEPQGSLHPDRYDVGDPYIDRNDWAEPDPQQPGPWPQSPCGVLGGQVVIGPTHRSISLHVKVGNAGSEHTLAGHVHLGRLGALYLHTEGHGKWLQRRLVPTGHESYVVEISAHDGTLFWKLWAPRDGFGRGKLPRWRAGSVSTNWRDHLLGRTVCTHEKVGDPADVVVRLHEGDEHPVTLQLEHWVWQRPRARRPDLVRWDVDWRSEHGIGTRSPGRGRIFGSGVGIEPAIVRAGTWVGLATAKVQAQIAEWRAREGYRAEVSA